MNRFFQKARDPVSSGTHFLGACLAVAGTLLLLVKCAFEGAAPSVTAAAVIFGASLIGLYAASSLYHYAHRSDKSTLVLRKLDHAMIYVLIAGTYTPLLLVCVQGTKGAVFTAVMWAVALAGTLLKVFWMGMPRVLSTVLYILMGWAILIDSPSLARLGTGGIVLLVLGGVMYTFGAVLYALKKPNPCKSFGFHEIFHIFVMLGSLFHYLCVFFYLI